MVAHKHKEFVRENLEWSFPPLDEIPEDEQKSILELAWQLADFITNGDKKAAETGFRTFVESSKHRFPEVPIRKILVLLGAVSALKLLEFVAAVSSSNRRLSGSEFLVLYKFRGGKNALHIALEWNHEEAVNYFLREWVQIEPIHYELRSVNFATFDSKSYFAEIFNHVPPDFHGANYDTKCKWYFYRRCMLRRKPVNTQTVHISEISDELQRELEEDSGLFDAILCYAAGNLYLGPLWELYGHEPLIFQAMAEWATSIDFKAFVIHQGVGSANMRLLEGYRDGVYIFETRFLRCLKQILHGKVQSAVSFFERVQDDWQNLRNALKMTSEAHGTDMFRRGMALICQKLHSRTLENEARGAVKFMSKHCSNIENSPSNSHTFKENQIVEARFLNLCSVAGTGKTQWLFDALSKNLGFYLVSGAISGDDKRSSHDTEVLYRPRTSILSGDAQLLFQITRFSWISKMSESTRRQYLFDFCDLLLENRLKFLSEVQKIDQDRTRSDIKPRTWLEFQLSHELNEQSFQKTYRLAVLGRAADRIHREQPDELRSRQILWCFDEVQSDLLPLAEGWGTNTLEGLLQAVADPPGTTGPGRHTAALAGTALDVDAVRQQLRWGIIVHGQWQWNEAALQSFPLVDTYLKFSNLYEDKLPGMFSYMWNASTSQDSHPRFRTYIPGNENTFKDLNFMTGFKNRQTQKHGIFHEKSESEALSLMQKHFESLRQQILRSSLPIWGRYRWSVCFIEELFKQYILNSGLTDSSIISASSKVQQEALCPLVERIRTLAKSPRKRALVNDLCWMAMDADLFNRSRVFPSAGTALLIQNAIGYVQEATIDGAEATRVCLAERLVINAVLKYLRETPELEALANEFIYAVQHNASQVGFATEVHFVASTYSKSLPPRPGFFSAFDDVVKVSTSANELNVNLGLDQYVLEQAPDVPDIDNLDKTWDVGEWLQAVHQESPRPTYLLPSTFAGPDVFFVLQRENEKNSQEGIPKRIVCAVQLKSGVSHDLQALEVIHTIDPDRWYSSAKDKKSDLDVQLEEISNRDDIGFLGILFIAALPKTDQEKFQYKLDFMGSRRQSYIDAQSKLSELLKDFRGKNSKITQKEIEQAKKVLEKERENLFKDPRATATGTTTGKRKRGSEGTDYYLQILAMDQVDSVFGSTFERLLHAIKGKKKETAAEDNTNDDPGSPMDET